jgi:hypothetical protein
VERPHRTNDLDAHGAGLARLTPGSSAGGMDQPPNHSLSWGRLRVFAMPEPERPAGGLMEPRRRTTGRAHPRRVAGGAPAVDAGTADRSAAGLLRATLARRAEPASSAGPWSGVRPRVFVVGDRVAAACLVVAGPSHPDSGVRAAVDRQRSRLTVVEHGQELLVGDLLGVVRVGWVGSSLHPSGPPPPRTVGAARLSARGRAEGPPATRPSAALARRLDPERG